MKKPDTVDQVLNRLKELGITDPAAVKAAEMLWNGATLTAAKTVAPNSVVNLVVNRIGWDITWRIHTCQQELRKQKKAARKLMRYERHKAKMAVALDHWSKGTPIRDIAALMGGKQGSLHIQIYRFRKLYRWFLPRRKRVRHPLRQPKEVT